MPQIMHALGTLFDLLLVVMGFGLIIVLHELGHFLAARWAGVRVLAFAIGFGPALLSWRKGLGFRRGSSEREYQRLLGAETAGATTVEGDRSTHHAVSPTEYRLNVIPFGGYVKMLGQDDADPTARSDAPDSYTSAKVWKRMVIISAGVAANLVVAAALFILVFLIGLKTEPATIGDVAPGSPAAKAVALNAEQAGVTEPGLQPGDRVLAIGSREPNSFNDLVLASAMTARGATVDLTVERPGVEEPLRFRIEPREDHATRMLQLGIGPAASNRLMEVAPGDDASRAEFARIMDRIGLTGVEPGMRLVSAAGQPLASADHLTRLVRRSADGSPINVTFADDSGREVHGVIRPRPELQSAEFLVRNGVLARVTHLLGLTAPMRVAATEPPAEAAGLRKGDVFVRIGGLEWPSIPAGMAEIRRHARGTVPVTVLRLSDSGEPAIVDLGEVPVSRKGTIGFNVEDTASTDTLIAPWPRLATTDPADGGLAAHPPAASLRLLPGSRILAVAGEPVSNFNDLRAALRRATETAAAAGTSAQVPLRIELPLPATDGQRPVEERAWTLDAGDVAALHALGWENPVPTWLFQREQVLLQADGPVGAIVMGLEETHRVMMSTYLTFARLFQGTVRVEHLHGPVGITHIGTVIAGRGLVWLLFFLALVSVNLAVVNFLPVPIADGGHMVFLIYEQLTGKPVSVAVQNAAAMVGFVLIVGLFLVVTFNDISRLIAP